MNNKDKKTIFLCGPMRGVPREISRGWREDAERMLSRDFNILHAFRGREERETMPDPRGAVIRDKRDINESDIVLVNDSFKDIAMVGTSMEVLHAHSKEKVVIIFGDANKGNYWLDYHSHMRLENLTDAVKVVKDLFI